MDRRKFVLSVGALAGGGSLALGTGAFSSVEAERDVGVTVADDASAYLGIQPGDGPNGNYVDTNDDDTLAINLTGDNDNIGDGLAGGEGLNTNAVTGISDLFEVQNQGTQPIDLEVSPLAFGDLDLDWFGVDGILGVLLVPQIGQVELDLNFDWTIPANMISISELAPGEAITFGLAAFAVPESAVDTVAVSDMIEITAEEQ